MMRVLVAGWFSWEHMGTTAGDLIARDIVCEWLEEACIPYEVAVHSCFPYGAAIDWEKADPGRYSDILFVCGPFGNGYPLTDLLQRFPNARLIGVDLSLLEPLENWNPFTLLYERDSSRASHPDITFCAPFPKVPVVGVILAHKQKEYGEMARHEAANETIEQFVNSNELAMVPIDTAILSNAGNLRTAGEIESLISKMDVVITTRLHGLVLALKNGVPVIAIDPIAGGAKITQQVKTIGWPVLFNAESLDQNALSRAFHFCLTPEARLLAKACAESAVAEVGKIRQLFISQLQGIAGSYWADNLPPS